MRKGFVIFALVLIALSIIAFVAADDIIPDGYHIKNCSDDYVLLESDQYHTISICALGSDADRNVLKYMLEKSMYDFTYTSNYTKGDFDIEENHYNQEYQSGILYLCDNGEELVVIDYKVPLGEEIEDSPVDEILDVLD